ncbi:glutaredoxin family protein [Thaumasiovibrio subtropicus]|uniref:glutaredoxin family protein n=1 Tax=Thaumasiovibrio subtropicus TaxID=1891207 RepID=UPI000B351AE2|nr:glutaredoxin family protein [Thaumasiovibrio subtropicus]
MKRVVLYTASRCPHCESAKQFLDDKGVTYRICDAASPRGRKELMAMGARGVPVVKIGDTVIRGFQPKAMSKALSK